MPDFAVRTAFSATDRISPAFRRMGAAANSFGARAEMAMMRARRATNRLIGSARRYIGMGLGVAAGLITREFINFDQALTSASAKFDRTGMSAAQLNDRMERMRTITRQVGATTEFTSSQAAQGLEYLAMAGFSAEQALSLLPSVTNLATGSSMDFARATDIASDAIGAFGMMSSDTATLTRNFARINDVMALTVTSVNTDMESLFETVRFAAPAFTTAGQSIETFNAIAGRMAANSIKGSQAGTALRAGILRLAAPPAAAAAALRRMNIRVTDSSGNMRNMIDIMQDIQTATAGMTQRQKLASLSAIFGTRAFSAWAAILNEGVDQTRALEERLQGANGASERMATIMRTSLLNKLKVLWSTIVEIGFVFIDAFAGDGGNAIESLTETVRGLSGVFKTLGKIFAVVVKFLPYIIGAFLAYKTVMTILAIKAGIMAAAQWIVNAAFLACPITWIIVGIIALVAAIILLIRNWDAVKAKMLSVWDAIKEKVVFVMSYISNVFKRFGDASFLDVIIAPINLLITQLRLLLTLATRLPGVGRYFARAAAAVGEFQAAANQAIGSQNLFAPNQAQQQQQVRLQGEININGAPPGSTARANTRGAENIAMRLMGVNP